MYIRTYFCVCFAEKSVSVPRCANAVQQWSGHVDRNWFRTRQQWMEYLWTNMVTLRRSCFGRLVTIDFCSTVVTYVLINAVLHPCSIALCCCCCYCTWFYFLSFRIIESSNEGICHDNTETIGTLEGVDKHDRHRQLDLSVQTLNHFYSNHKTAQEGFVRDKKVIAPAPVMSAIPSDICSATSRAQLIIPLAYIVVGDQQSFYAPAIRAITHGVEEEE